MFLGGVVPVAGTTSAVSDSTGSPTFPIPSPTETMASNTATLGRCPSCETPIPQYSLLIEYERDDGHAAFAECPGCDDVVRPS